MMAFLSSIRRGTQRSNYVPAQAGPLRNITLGRLGMDQQQNPVLIGGPFIRYGATASRQPQGFINSRRLQQQIRFNPQPSSPGYRRGRSTNSQPVVIPTTPPPGSYALTCTGSVMNGKILNSNCLDTSNVRHATSLDLSTCTPGYDVTNINGGLICGSIPARQGIAQGKQIISGSLNPGVSEYDGGGAFAQGNYVAAPAVATVSSASASSSSASVAASSSGTDWQSLISQYWWVGAVGLGALLLLKGRR